MISYQILCALIPIFFHISVAISAASAFPDPLVTLDYGSFQGKWDSTYNISYFRKIPFGASTAGVNRFRAPQPPAPITNGTYNSDQSFDMCPCRTVNGTEDCLYLGLYSRPWTKSMPKRPVLVVYYGGAFIQGSASFSIPPSAYPILNASVSNDYITVYPNYRLNAFGFLPGRKIKESRTADLNPGLLDQQAALKWVHKYIAEFGGDPANVTIQGQSAGGGSVVAQNMANGGNTTPRLFSKVLANSPFWPKTYKYDAPEAEAIYSQLVNLTGCATAKDTLDCLKSVDAQTIRNASLIIDADHTYTTSSYTWAPVVDGEFLQTTLTEAVSRGKGNADFVFSWYNTHEGENFIPPGFSSSAGSGGFNSSVASFNSWLRGFMPKFSDDLIEKVIKLYPVNGTEETFSYTDTYTRAGLVYRDAVLACPSYWTAQSARRTGYQGEYTISPAKHASDTIYWNSIGSIQQTQPLIYQGFTGAFASFIQTGDPNAHKLTNATEPGVPRLKTGEEFVVTASGFENVKIVELKQRCDFWKSVAGHVPI